MRGSKSGGSHHGLTELISEPSLLLFIVRDLFRILVLRFLGKPN
jgi:hypothetical protein